MKYKQVEEHQNYIIFENGDIYSLYSNKFLKPSKTGRQGYLGVSLNSKTRKIHRLVAEAFIEIDTDRVEVNHKNLNKHDNRVENLEWCTRQENVDHAIKNFKYTGGKLSEKQINEIKEKYIPYKTSTYDLASEYGVSNVMIWKIVKEISWSVN